VAEVVGEWSGDHLGGHEHEMHERSAAGVVCHGVFSGRHLRHHVEHIGNETEAVAGFLNRDQSRDSAHGNGRFRGNDLTQVDETQVWHVDAEGHEEHRFFEAKLGD